MFLYFLFQHLVSCSNSPVVRFRHGWTKWTTTCRLHLLPVILACTGSHPRFCVHFKTLSPWHMLLTPCWHLAPLLSKLLCHSPDVVGLKPTAAPDVTNPQFKSLASIFMHIPPCRDSGFECKRKLREVNDTLLPCVRAQVGNRLHHEVGGKSSSLKSSFHLLHRLKSNKHVKMAIDANYMSSCSCHLDGALSSRVAVQVTLRSDAHRCRNRQTSFETLLYRPLSLLNVLKILTQNKVKALLHEDIKLLLENSLDSLLSLASQIGGGLRYSTQGKCTSLCCNLPGQSSSCPIYGVAADFLPRFVSAVGKLVLGGIIRESLHNI